jgi:hypothetical protein
VKREITDDDVARAIAIMARMIHDFPQNELEQKLVANSIKKYVSTRGELLWLTETACEVMRWFSIPELRGIFCSRYKPADGVWVEAKTPGFTYQDVMSAGEKAYHEREALEEQRKLIQWKREMKLLTGSDEPYHQILLPAPEIEAVAEAISMPRPTKRPQAKAITSPEPSTREIEQRLQQVVAETPRRTPEETARILAELEQRLKDEAV